MKKAKILIILSIFLLFAAQAYTQEDLWFYRSSYLILESTISTSFDVVSKPNQNIDYVIANISFFPRQTNTQGILESDYSPMPEISKDTLTFRWKSPAPGNINIKIKNKIKTINSPSKITKKVAFPIQEEDIPEENILYTKPSEIIDINSRIINLASEIASGEDDLFLVVDKIANWVNVNIKYNLTTITAEAAQKSSWVLEHREGVCDELTSLFISMLRSLGIPARFVSGVSYTNMDIFENKWGAHGWAEVFFPGYGWVPFDVTYGEYGWVDPTHIVSKTAEDAGKFTSRYTWRAENGVSLKIGSLNTDVKIIEKGQPKDTSILVDVGVLKENTGFGSYNLIIARVKNLANYYQSFDVYISHTTRLSYIGNYKKHVVLKPNEEKNIYWIVKTDDGLDRNYMYTFPIAVYTLENITSKTSFISVDDADIYSLEEINRTLMQSRVEDVMVYSRKVKLNCSPGKKEYYEYEKPSILCFIKNTGNVFLKGTRICLRDDCMIKNIGITEEKEINFTVHEKELGENEIKITVTNEEVSKVSYVNFVVLDKPEVDVDDVEYPSNVEYKENYVLKFNLKKKSESRPQNVDMIVRVNRKKIKFSFDELNESREIEIYFAGKHLTVGENKITISIIYNDKNGKEYDLSRSYSINLINVTWFQKVVIFFKTIF